MRQDILIGIDAGTSVIKAVAFDLSGRQVAIASRRNAYVNEPGGGVVQDMGRTWRDTANVLRELTERVDGLAQRVLALAVTGQGDGTWLVDANGEPVHDAWLWLDARAVAEAREIASSDRIDLIYEKTGTGVNVCQMRTHLRWMKRNAPDLLAKAATAFHCKDWIYFNLTGIRAADPSEGVFTFGDFRTRGYCENVVGALDLSDLRHLLPPIVDGAVEAHPLSASAARATGLPEGLPVSLAYVDVMCSALGGGLYDPQQRPGLTVLGSTGVHIRFVPDPKDVHLNAERSGYTMTLPGTQLAQMQTNMAATLNIDWMLGLASQVLASHGLARSHSDLLDKLDDRVLAARPGAALYHPYISEAGERGPFAEPYARASFTGLNQQTDWFGMVRAVYEGLAFASRDCYAVMGEMPGEIRLSGGAAQSSALRKILSAALNTPTRTVDQPEAGAAGAVMIAAVAAGVFPDIEAVSKSWILPLLNTPEPPDAELARHYRELFDVYVATRHALAPVWERQACTGRTVN